MTTWTDGNGYFYEGDCAPGDRAATGLEGAALATDQAKRDKRAEIDAGFAAAIAAGVAHRGKTIALDAATRNAIAGDAVLALGVVLGADGLAWDPAYYWTTADGSALTLTAAQHLDLLQAITGRRTVLVQARDTLRAAVDDAADAAAVAAIDVEFPE